MKIVCKLGRSAAEPHRAHELDLLVRLCAPGRTGHGRAPLTVVPVVDVSSSMGGEPIGAVHEALERLLDHLVPGDHVAVITFESRVTAVVPLCEATAARKTEIAHIVRGLRTGRGTNLGGGLLRGLQEAALAVQRTGGRARVILLTDGQPSEGPAQEPDDLRAIVEARPAGVTVSAFGYAEHCDHDLLGALAEAGRGGYAYIEHCDTMLTAFRRELGGLVSTYASEVRVRVTTGRRPFECAVDDLLEHGERRAVAPVALGPKQPGDAVEVGEVEVSWLDALGRPQTTRVPLRLDVRAGAESLADDPEVLRAGDERRLRNAQRAADSFVRRGDLDGAQSAFRREIASVRDPGVLAFAWKVLLPCYANQHAYRQSGGLRTSAAARLEGSRQRTFIPGIEEALGSAPD